MEENHNLNDSLDNSEDLADMDQEPEEEEEQGEEEQSPTVQSPGEEEELTWEQRKQLKQAEKAQYQLEKAQKREEYQKLREQKFLLKQKKADEREENRKEREQIKLEREQIKLERERLKIERNNDKRKRAEEREEAKQERLANTFNRRCKGSCGKSRSNKPPQLDKRSRWFVCYGCKAYNLCIKCGANNPQDYALFQEHSQQCDPYYQERIAQQAPQPVPPPTVPPPAPVHSPITVPVPVTPYTPIITMEDYDLEDSGDDYFNYDQLNYSLPSQAQNLLNFYVPPKTQESTYKGCWTGDSLIYKSDGSLIEAKKILPGDFLIDFKKGQPIQVAAVLVTTIPAQDPPVKLVQLSQHCTLTSGHPVLDLSRGIYVRADTLGKCHQIQRVEKLFNFELKDRGCEGIICDGGIIAATVGKSFEEIKKVSLENDQAWGDGYWTSTRELLRNNYFPNIKYLTSSS